MKRVKLQIFYGYTTSVERAFNQWIENNPDIEIKHVQAVVDPNPSPHYTGDLILLVFYQSN